MNKICRNCGKTQIDGASLRVGSCHYCGWYIYNPHIYTDTANTEMIRFMDIIKEQNTRIAELEAEVERLKDMHKAKWKDAYSRICPDITQEGEG